MANDSYRLDPPVSRIRLAGVLYVGLVFALFSLPDQAFGFDDDVAQDGETLPEQPIEIAVLNRGAESQLNVAMADAEAALKTLDAGLPQRIEIVRRVCGLTEVQREKLQLAARGDKKRILDRIEQLKAIRTEWKRVSGDAEMVTALLIHEDKALKHRLMPVNIDDALSLKALEHLLTAEQRAKYQPFRAILRSGGWVRPFQDGMEIVFSEKTLTDDGLAAVSQLGNVRSLKLDGTRDTDFGMQRLKALTELRRLELHNSQLTDVGLEHLNGLTKLEWLALDRTRVTDAAFTHLNGMTELKSLSLSLTGLTDAGLAHLAHLSKLQRLQLRSTSVTDAGLARLNGLTELEFLGLSKTAVTDAGVAELQRALPKVRVER
jgi:hypothetical protein